MVGSVMNEGVRGMQLAQRELDRAAVDIARAPVNNPAAAAPVAAEAGQPPESRQDIIQPLVDLARQEQLFTASAKVVSTANQTLGILVDLEV